MPKHIRGSDQYSSCLGWIVLHVTPPLDWPQHNEAGACVQRLRDGRGDRSIGQAVTISGIKKARHMGTGLTSHTNSYFLLYFTEQP